MSPSGHFSSSSNKYNIRGTAGSAVRSSFAFPPPPQCLVAVVVAEEAEGSHPVRCFAGSGFSFSSQAVTPSDCQRGPTPDRGDSPLLLLHRL